MKHRYTPKIDWQHLQNLQKHKKQMKKNSFRERIGAYFKMKTIPTLLKWSLIERIRVGSIPLIIAYRWSKVYLRLELGYRKDSRGIGSTDNCMLQLRSYNSKNCSLRNSTGPCMQRWAAAEPQRWDHRLPHVAHWIEIQRAHACEDGLLRNLKGGTIAFLM